MTKIKTPEEIIETISELIPQWELLGYGAEIIQYQIQENNGQNIKWTVLTLRSVKWEKNLNNTHATKCPWYIDETYYPLAENLKLIINKALEKLNTNNIQAN